MTTLRFGQKLKLPSTVAIKRGIMMLMLRDEQKVQASLPMPVEESAAGVALPGRD